MNRKISCINEEHFYKSYNMSLELESNKEKFIDDIETRLRTYPSQQEPTPPRRTYATMPEANKYIQRLSENYYWKNLFKTIFLEVNTYYNNYLNATPTLINFWMDKVDFYSDEEINKFLYFDEDLGTYTDDVYHSHEYLNVLSKSPINSGAELIDSYFLDGVRRNVLRDKNKPSAICIFFLQNCNKKYGTLVKTKTGSLIVDGEENSLSIFNSQLFHTAVYPKREESEKYPRYTLGFDFKSLDTKTKPCYDK